MVNKRQDYSAYIISFYLCSFLEILESSSISYHIQYICVIIGYVIFIGGGGDFNNKIYQHFNWKLWRKR